MKVTVSSATATLPIMLGLANDLDMLPACSTLCHLPVSQNPARPSNEGTWANPRE
jgi:hypothetical protein